jgi:thiamine transport system permease protein
MTARDRGGLRLPLVLFVALFAIAPVAVLLAAGLVAEGPSGVARTLADPLNRAAIDNSLLQGTLSALAAVGVGYPIGLVLGRYVWPGQSTVRAVLVVPFLLPSLVVVLGVESILGPAGLLGGPLPILRPLGTGVGGIVVVNVVFNLPLVALLTAVGIESASGSLEETLATLGASPWQVYRRVWGPPSWRGAAAGALLTFLFSALAFAAPLLLCGPRCYTIEARVWSLVQVLLAPGEAAILAGFMVALLALPTFLYLLLIVRPAVGSGPRRAPRTLPVASARHWPLLAAPVLGIAFVAALLGSVIVRGLSAAAPGGPPGSAWAYLAGARLTQSLGISTGGALVNSLLFAGASTAIGVTLALLAAAGGQRTGDRFLRMYLFLPLLLSPVVLSFALATVWRPLLGGEANVWLLILVSQATLGLPFALQALEVGLAPIPRRFRETAQLLGARPFTAYLEVDVAIARPALLTAALFVFALSFGEFTATFFLATPTFTTLPVELYRLEALRATGPAAAVAALLVLVSLAAFLALQRGGNRAIL